MNQQENTLFDFEIEEVKPKMFKKEIDYKLGAIIKVLEKHAVGYENRKKADWLLPHVNNLLNRGYVKDDFELRMLIKKLKNSSTYMRVIGTTSAGTWLACNDDEVKANSYMTSRIESSIKTALKNGVEITYFYKMLNEIQNPNMPVDNQTRNQFNTEKTVIKRFSDDLKTGGKE